MKDQAAAAPDASALRRCLVTWAVMALLWLPLCMLQQIDALLMFSTWPELLRDAALLVWLCALPAAALGLMGSLAARIGRRCGLGPSQVEALAWSVTLLPSAWLFAWQFARTAWQWVRLVSGSTLIIAPSTRVAVLALTVGVLAWAGRQVARRPALWPRVLNKLDGLRRPMLAVAALALACVAISPPRLARDLPAPAAAASGQPDVVILSVDALSALDADWCEVGATPLPHLRALAAESLCYSHLYAASNFTTPTTTTLETGALPWSHLASQLSAKPVAPYRTQTLAALLREAGYRTYTTTDNPLASSRHRATDAGYMRSQMTPSRVWRDRLRASFTALPDSSLPMLIDSALSFLGAFDVQWFGADNPFDSRRLFSQVLPWLQEAPSPAFIWLHSMPPHSPYLPPPQTKYKLLPRGSLERWSDFMDDNNPYAPSQQPVVDQHRLRYRESIMAVDEAVGELIAQLRAAGRLDRTLLIVTSDHGESFEKGFLGHAGPGLHEALIRVPLLIRLPGQGVAQRIDQPVSQADIAPTVTDALHLPAAPWFEGHSLLPPALAAPTAPRTVFSMAMERQSRFRPLRVGHYVAVDDRYKYVWHLGANESELYDLQADPAEAHNLVSQAPEVAQRMRAQLEAQLAAAEARRVASVAGP